MIRRGIGVHFSLKIGAVAFQRELPRSSLYCPSDMSFSCVHWVPPNCARNCKGSIQGGNLEPDCSMLLLQKPKTKISTTQLPAAVGTQNNKACKNKGKTVSATSVTEDYDERRTDRDCEIVEVYFCRLWQYVASTKNPEFSFK